MSRRDGTFKIRQDKPIKNCGTTVITPRTKGDVPAAKTVRNVHTIEPIKPLFPKIINYTVPTENITEPIEYDNAKKWIPQGPYTKNVEFPIEVIQEMEKVAEADGIEKVAIEVPVGEIGTLVEGEPTNLSDVHLPKLDPMPPIQEWTEGVSDIKDEASHFEQPTPSLTPQQEKELYTEEEKERAAAAVSSNPIEVVKKHTRGRKKKEVVSNEDTTLSPANNEDIKE